MILHNGVMFVLPAAAGSARALLIKKIQLKQLEVSVLYQYREKIRYGALHFPAPTAHFRRIAPWKAPHGPRWLHRCVAQIDFEDVYNLGLGEAETDGSVLKVRK